MASVAERRFAYGLAAGIAVADFVTKLLAESLLARRLPLPVLGDWVVLRLVYNPCAAFGICMGASSRWVFFSLTILALILLVRMLAATRDGDRFRLVALALVIGGALGNLVDRLRSPVGVVDFVDVGIGVHRWPTFNLADSAITVGAVALAVWLWQHERSVERAKEAQAAEP
ncbi:MAG TPA: signal peptidase II [Gemmatimonadales bacterium]|nr:signal peptidase II [Gemmatimonadales bacterium]